MVEVNGLWKNWKNTRGVSVFHIQMSNAFSKGMKFVTKSVFHLKKSFYELIKGGMFFFPTPWETLHSLYTFSHFFLRLLFFSGNREPLCQVWESSLWISQHTSFKYMYIHFFSRWAAVQMHLMHYLLSYKTIHARLPVVTYTSIDKSFEPPCIYEIYRLSL